MKKITFLLVSSLVIVACQQSETNKTSTALVTVAASADSNTQQELIENGGPTITFEKMNHDFGTITQGEQAEYSFKFTNTGNQDLIIANAQASCGCTVPEYSKEPIKPGAQGLIKVKFNSDYRLDAFEKTVVVTANTIPTDTELKIKGFINPKPGTQTQNTSPIH